ncbi:MAG: ADOP family duplicated permease [Thermoanaerobaculia bacterium]
MQNDLRFALRALGRSPGFALAAIATLALGLGANALVFSLVDALILRPLPFGERTARLVTLHSTHPTQARDWDDSPISYADLVDLRERTTAFEAIEGYAERNFSLIGPETTERVAGASVTPGLFRLLGMQPIVGRDFREDEGAEPGFETVALISHDLWQRSFGGDEDVVGGPIGINGRSLTIVGVMPPGFGFPEREDLWVPYAGDGMSGRDVRGLIGVALMKDGVPLVRARSDLAAAAADLARLHPDTNRDRGVHAIPLREFYVGGGARRAASAMLGAVALVLLVACANVAGLMLARGLGRERELTVRAALGAGRARLARLVAVEGAIVAAAGAAIGLGLAAGGLRLLAASMPEPPPFWAEFVVGGRVVAFVAVAAIVATVGAGLIPALRITRVDLASALQGSRGSAGGSKQRRAQTILVTAQVAVTLVLLVGAVLLSDSARRLQNADAGFDPRPILSMRLYIAGDAYDDPSVRAQTVERIAARVAAIPGVEAVAASGAIPADDGGTPMSLASPRAVAGEELGAQGIPVTAGLWDVLGRELIDGRTFTSDELRDPATNVVVVNERLASTMWPGESAIGREVVFVRSNERTRLRVIGVAPDLVFEELGEETAQSRLQVYFPWAARPWRSMALLVRAAVDPASLISPVRGAVREIDPAFAAFDAMTMTERRRFTHWAESFLGRVFAAFGFGALLLACVGAYGLAAYSAAQRRREIAVRFALGATRSTVLALLLRRGAVLALAGLAAGLPLALGAARLIEALLFGVSPWDVGIWIVTPLALAGAVLLATWLPSRRAAETDPADALRYE